MRAHKNRPEKRLLPALVLVLSLLTTSAAFGQGSIFGAVTNSDVSVPANGEISFFGYLDDTDEEIRIESSVGAGYDAGNWYDDFQNYLTEAPGNPYDYHFFNTANSEGHVLSKLIPNNSFQQEDIALAAVAWPAATTGLTGKTISSSAVVVSWNGTTGITYHVYRRLAISDGSFFRIDDPTGSLSNPGTADSFFVDTGVDGVSDYHYLIVPEDGSGNLGPHSTILTVSSATIDNPVVDAINPNSGFTIGGTPVTITGSGFDPAGAVATIGGVALASQVIVSPFVITGLTPAGTAGAVDVVVTNTASTLASVPLVGGFTYVANSAPAVADIPDQIIAEGAIFTTINLDNYVTDVDNTDDEITWTTSGEVELTVNIDAGRIATVIIPSVDWNGAETITFRAEDPGTLADSNAATFTVTTVNDAPVVTGIPDQTIAEGAIFTTINLDDYVSDIDNTDAEMIWSYSGNTALTVDITARVATITIPDADWNGAETITFTAEDPGLLSDGDAAVFTVTAVNDAPLVAGIPDQTIAEGATFATINLDDYVSDIDNTDAEMTWTYSGNTVLTVDITARVATITIPDADWNGAETITFTAEDPGLLSDNDVAVFTVTAVNDAPVVAGIPDQTIAEGATFATINLDDYVSDIDNADAEMIWSYGGNTALTVDITARVATITIPDVNWNGAETITFTAEDPGLLTGSDSAVFTVTAVNDAPVVIDIPDQTVAEGVAFATINLDDYVSDIDNTDAEMIWTYSGNTELIVDITARVATITVPSPDWNGSETITFTAEDPGLLSAGDAATFTVSGDNDAPVVSDIPDQTIAEGATFATINLDDYVSDIDNTDAEMTWTYSGNTALTVDITARVATITIPDADWNGAETIMFTATDPGLLSDSNAAVFTVTAVNDAPVVAGIPNQTIAEGATFATINLDDYVNDVDNTDLEMTWSYSGNTDLTVDITARVATITIPDVDWNGSETITFTAEDPGLLTGSGVAIFTVTAVNDAPVVTDIPDQTIPEGSTFSFVSLDDYVSDIDNTDEEMLWTYSGNVELTVTIINRVAIIGIPAPDWNGSETITFTAEDPGLLTGSDSATFTVSGDNDPPVVTDIPDQTITEGMTFTTINLDDYVSDIDNTDDEMIWTYSGNTELTVDITARVATITMPDLDWNGAETITFRATDPGLFFSEDAATFTVTAVNDAPVVADIPDQTIAEGATFATINLDDYVSDVDNADTEISWTYSGNTVLAVDITARVAAITIPDPEWSGTETITFTAEDPGLLSAGDSAVFTVTAVNDAPIVTDIPDQTIIEGASFATINLDDYVSDADNTDAEMLWSYSGNTELTVDITARVATITIPTLDWNGSETITFTAEDPGLLTGSDAATFTVSSDNDAPVVTDIPDQIVTEGATFVTINLDDYVSDLDNTDDEMTWTYSGNTELAVNITTRVATIVIPGLDWFGSETITFRATDPGLLFAEDAATFTVTAIADPPVLDSIGAQIVYETDSLILTVSASDPDGTIPTLSATDVPTNGLFVDNLDGTGSFTFAPDYTQEGIYNVTFKAFDGVDVDSEVVEITVLNTNRSPVLDSIGPQAATENVQLLILITASDPDGTIPVLSTSILPANAIFTDSLNGVGSFDFTPDFSQQGLHQIMFYASDGTDIDSELVAITVGDAGNQAPILDSIGALFVSEGATLNVTITGSDPDGTIPDLAAVNMPTNATFTDNLDGSGIFNFIPDFTQAGVYGVTFIADDGVLADSEMVLVSVTELGNQAPVLDPIISPQVVNENSVLTINLSATDADFDNLRFTFASNSPMVGLSVTDNFDGTGILNYAPDYLSAGIDTVKVFVTDDGTPPLSDVQEIEIQTLEVNRPPQIDSIGPYFVKVARTLNFTVMAHDTTDQSDGTLYLTASGLPANATFVDNGDGTGNFSFTPDVSQVGVDTVRFIVIDNFSPPMSGALDVEITVVATNQAPELAYIGPQIINEGDTLIFAVSATDADGTIPTLSAEGPSGNPLPTGASFVDNLDGTGEFRFESNFIQSGLYGIEIRASDGIDVDKETVLIQVVEAGNQAPNIWFIGPQIVTEAELLEFSFYGDDPDSTIPSLAVDSLPPGASYVDSGNGYGSFSWTPGYTQSGFYNVYFMADDGAQVDTEIVEIEVIDAGNQTPTLDPVDPVSGFETDLLFFVVISHDLDGVIPILTTSPLPAGATFDDNGDYSGLFQWTTGYFDEGTHVITVYATDADDPTLVDSVMVTVIIENTNQLPGWSFWDWPTYDPIEVDEGDSLDFLIIAYDLDLTDPILTISENIPNFTFVDSGNGTGVLTLQPDYDQEGVYYVHFIARDSDPRYPNDTVAYLGETGFKISVNNVDRPPVLTPIGPKTVMEGDTLNVWVTASDPDGQNAAVFAEDLPANSSFSGILSAKTFLFIPDYLQAGEYTVLFTAVSVGLADSEYVTITVTEAGNQSPYFEQTFADSITMPAGASAVQHIVTVDPEGDPITITLLTPPLNVVFIDSGNGAASMVFTPDPTQYDVTHVFRYVATDSFGAADTAFSYIKAVTFTRGDANSDNAVNVADASFLITYIFRQGRAPEIPEAADANFDNTINVSDAVYLINYIFKHGPPPPDGN